MTRREHRIEIAREERELWREVYTIAIDRDSCSDAAALESIEAVNAYREFVQRNAKADADLYENGALEAMT